MEAWSGLGFARKPRCWGDEGGWGGGVAFGLGYGEGLRQKRASGRSGVAWGRGDFGDVGAQEAGDAGEGRRGTSHLFHMSWVMWGAELGGEIGAGEGLARGRGRLGVGFGVPGALRRRRGCRVR